MDRHKPTLIYLMGLLVGFGLLITQGLAPADAQEPREQEKKPARLIVMAAEYPGVVVPADETVSMDLTFYNRGRSDESVAVWVAEKPEGRDAKIKTYKFTVTGTHVASGEDKRLTFEADPGEDTQPGKYRFLVKAQTPDGRFKLDQPIEVEVTAKEAGKKEDKGVKLNTSYPVLQGPTDGKFEFSVEVESKLDQDAVFNLFAQGPEGWDINFKPAYEDKYISSLRIKANQNETVAVVVKPAANASAGEYPVNIRVASSDANGEAKLNVVLTGTYGLEVGTASGLLSLDARQGKPANISFYIKNTGSAPNSNLKFLTFKPENWKVTFNPENIAVLEPGKLQQVEITITPNEEALVGDYSVNVQVEGEKATKSLEFRTTVKASAAWGWVGIAIIVAVIAGLVGLFRGLGRR